MKLIFPSYAVGKLRFKNKVVQAKGDIFLPRDTAFELEVYCGIKDLSFLGDDCFFGLTDLNLSYTCISNVDLEVVKKLVILKNLDLSFSSITDDGLLCLRESISLTALNLCGTTITDIGLKYLKELTKLINLNLKHTRITSSGYQQLSEHLPCTQIYCNIQ